MKLRKVTPVDFKSFPPDRTLDVAPRVTILVGPNQAGKTNLLLAMSKLRPEESLTLEDTRHASDRYAEDRLPEIVFEFGDFTDDEKAKLRDIHEDFAELNTLQVVRKGAAITDYFISADGEEIHVAELPGEEAAAAQTAEIEGDSEQEEMKKPQTQEELIRKVVELLPPVRYFPQEDIPRLRGDVSVHDLRVNRASVPAEANLLSIGGIHAYDSLASEGNHLKRQLRNIEQQFTERFVQFWMQDSTIRFNLDCHGGSLSIRVSDATRALVKPEDCSQGFRNYLEFFIHFTAGCKGELAGNILLLDEPGAGVHPGAQKDLVDLIEQFAGGNQIVYTCHSPYLINKNYPGRLRVITKEQDPDKGSQIENKPYHCREPYYTLQWEALRFALGMNLADSLFLGEKNLIVEGPTDQILFAGLSQIFATMKDTMAQMQQPALDYLDLQELSIVPAGGAREAPRLARMAVNREADVVVLVDCDKEGQDVRKRIERSREDWGLGEDQVCEVGLINEVVGGQMPEGGNTTEDLVPVKWYLKAVNSYYRREAADVFQKIEKKDLSTEHPIASALERYFEDQKDWPDFSKVAVAKQLVNMLWTGEPGGGDSRLLRDALEQDFALFQTLFERVNRAFREGKLVTETVSKPEPPSLTDIHGIGSGFEKRLHGEGIKTVKDLAEASPEQLMEITGRYHDVVEKWISEAKDLAGKGQ